MRTRRIARFVIGARLLLFAATGWGMLRAAPAVGSTTRATAAVAGGAS